jgi:glycine dehydrogenase subunit 1
MWAIVTAVYLALMGPKGMQDLGEVILRKSHYAAEKLSEIEGIKIPFPTFFKEFVVKFETRKKTSRINKTLLKHRIFGGKDISSEFPELGSSSLYCITEIHSKDDILRLAESLKEALR